MPEDCLLVKFSICQLNTVAKNGGVWLEQDTGMVQAMKHKSDFIFFHPALNCDSKIETFVLVSRKQNP